MVNECLQLSKNYQLNTKGQCTSLYANCISTKKKKKRELGVLGISLSYWDYLGE